MQQPTTKTVNEMDDLGGAPVRCPYWLLREWWAYVLDDSRCYNKSHGGDEWLNGRLWRWLSNHDWRWTERASRAAAYLFRCQCRARNHPYGVAFYNVGGLEPDMTCNGCGEDLG